MTKSITYWTNCAKTLPPHTAWTIWQKKLAVSRRTFIRHFSQATGMNFSEWLTTERLWQAQDLLENTDLPIERIAEQSGFGSAANLRLQFKAKFKINPNAWRKVFGR